MLVMRLQRIGKRGQAYFRLIVTEHTKKPQGEYLELSGSYDPHRKDLKAKKDRIEHWISQGVQMSPTFNNLLVNNKIIATAKMASWRPKPKAKVAAPTVAVESKPAPVKEEAAPTAEELKAEESKTETPAE